jgi:hypothetical protein
MSITQATSSVLAANASLDNLNSLATIAFTKAVTSSSTLNITGAVIFGNTLVVTNNIQSSAGNISCAAAGSLSVLGRSRIYSSSDGTFQFRNNANGADASLTAAGLTLTTTPLAAGSGGTGLSSLGTGVATFLGTPTSDNLRAALTNTTGTGPNVFSNNPTITDYTESTVVIGNSGVSQTISLTNGTVQTCTLTGNCTFTMPSATSGKSFTLLLNTGAGSFTASFTGVKWPGNVAPIITTTASRMDIISFISNGTSWFATIAQNYTP